MTPKQLLRRALDLATEKLNDNAGGPFGAVIARDGEIIAEGWNQVVGAKDPTAHAEVVAIREACRKLGTFSLAGCEIYASCEPCPMCLAAIYWARLDRVHFAAVRADAERVGFDDSRLYRELALPLGARSLPMIQLKVEDPLRALRAWQAKPDKTPY
jgi:tRNA(Arg) A34 adenosine deaminase TadA